MSHQDVIYKFSNRDINSRTKTCSWSGSNVFCDGDILYSYGRHFPMAKYLGEMNGKTLFVKNTDKYSCSTSRHQGITDQFCPGPLLSASRYQSLSGKPFEDIKLEDVILFRPEFYKFVYQDKITGFLYEKCHQKRWAWSDEPTPPNPDSEWFVGGLEEKLLEGRWIPDRPGGSFNPDRKRDKNRSVSGTWAVTNASVIKIKRKFYLCSHDFGKGHFMVAVPKPKTIEEAFESIKR